MSRVFVPEEEYERLRQIKKEHSKLLEQQAGDQKKVEQQRRLLAGQIEVNRVNQAALDRANAARREDLAPLHEGVVGPSPEASAAEEGLAEAGESPSCQSQDARETAAGAAAPTTAAAKTGTTLLKSERERNLGLVARGSIDLSNLADSFSSPSQWSKAMSFLQRALVHQSVHLDRGLLFLDGRKIGHIVLVLYHLFGGGGGLKSGLQHRSKLASFVRQVGISSNSAKKKKSGPKSKGANKNHGGRGSKKTKTTKTHTSPHHLINPALYELMK